MFTKTLVHVIQISSQCECIDIRADVRGDRSPLFDETNKKVIGKMKDECAGTPIAEYIGLRPKLYSVLRADEQLIKKAKGVKNM